MCVFFFKYWKIFVGMNCINKSGVLLAFKFFYLIFGSEFTKEHPFNLLFIYLVLSFVYITYLLQKLFHTFYSLYFLLNFSSSITATIFACGFFFYALLVLVLSKKVNLHFFLLVVDMWLFEGLKIKKKHLESSSFPDIICYLGS